MRVLAIDQSVRCTGVVVLDYLGGILKARDTLTIKSSKTGIHCLPFIYDEVCALIDEYKPNILSRELHNHRQHGAAQQLQAVAAMIDLVAYRREYVHTARYHLVTQGCWKKIIFDKGNFKKDEAYLLHLNNRLSKIPWLDLSQVAGECGIESVDIADAICIGVVSAMIGVPTVPRTKAQEAVLAKSEESILDYGKV